MNVEVHIDWQGQTHFVGRLHPAQRSAAVTFAYADSWLARADAFAIDPTSLPLRPGPQHGALLFGAMQDCGPDRWGRLLLARGMTPPNFQFATEELGDFRCAGVFEVVLRRADFACAWCRANERRR